MARIRTPSFRLRLTKKQAIIAGTVVVLGIGAIIASFALRPSHVTTAPTYDVVLPHNRSVDDLGGWQRVSPPGSDPVFAFGDRIGDVAISVSQQPIPQSFTSNIAANVEQLAKSYNATTMIKAGDTPVFIGQSAKGPQSVIFAKDNVLVLIKSQDTIDHELWIRYISALTDPRSNTTPTF